MKERGKQAPKYLVCYDGYRCIGWKNIAEFHDLLNKGLVDWYMGEDKRVTNIKMERKNEQRGE